MNKKCPYCSYPLGDTHRCVKCDREICDADFPPGRLAYSYSELGMGSPINNLRQIEKYDFQDNWEPKVVTANELAGNVMGELVQIDEKIAKQRDLARAVVDELVQGDIANYLPREVLGQMASVIGNLSTSVLEALYESPEIPKISIKPTAWDEYYESKLEKIAFARVYDGLYIGIPATCIKAASAIFGFVKAHLTSSDGLEYIKVVWAAGLAFHAAITNYIRLEGDRRLVFESIHSQSTKQPVKNWDDFRRCLSMERILGTLGPTSVEVKNDLAGVVDTQRVDEVLQELASDKVARVIDGRWYIKF